MDGMYGIIKLANPKKLREGEICMKMKKSIFIFPILLFTLTLFILTNIKKRITSKTALYYNVLIAAL